MLVRATRRLRQNAFWHSLVEYLSIAAEVSNIGIFLEILGRWLPRFAAFVAGSPLGYLTLLMDPLIYFFRALIRLTKLVGRKLFHIQFEEEVNGPLHPWQTRGDLLSLACFALAIILFSGVLIAGPVSITLAWIAGLSGLSCIGYFDYRWPEQQAYKKFVALMNRDEATREMQVKAYAEYIHLKKSRQLYVVLLVGLSLLLICSSAAVFAPPLLVPLLSIASKGASLFLGGLGCARLYNWYRTRKNPLVLVEEEASLSFRLFSREVEMVERRPQPSFHRQNRSSSSPSQSGIFSPIPSSSLPLPGEVKRSELTYSR